MRIALIGTRGAPAAYGGFETAVDEVGARLAKYGHDVTVYCRGRAERLEFYRGMRTVDLPAVRNRAAETLSHTLLSILDAILRRRPDVAIVFNAANSPLLPLLRAAGIPCALHTDGLEWKRGKWGPVGKRYYLLAEALGVSFADALISDAEGIADYYRERYGAESSVIRYGADLVEPGPERLAEMGLRPGKYHLVVARLEPENHVDVIVRGFCRSAARAPLVIVGSVPYPTGYTRALEQAAAGDERVKMVGGVYDQDLLDSLYAHAAVYLHGHSVGGTNPSLLRAMGAGAPVAVYDVSFNREVLGAGPEAAWRDPDDVADILRRVEGAPEEWRRQGQASRSRVAAHYQWSEVAASYAHLSTELASGRRRRPRGGIRLLAAAVRASSDPQRGHGPWSA